MTDYTTLSNTAVGVGGLPSGATVTALRDNPIAIAEGAAGAPRVVDAALDTTATAAGDAWVVARSSGIAGVIAGYSVGGIGTYAMLRNNGTSRDPGSTQTGSLLNYSSAAGDTVTTVISGTWRCMGRALGSSSAAQEVSMWLRIV